MAESIVGTPTTSPLKMSDSPDGDGPKVETKAHYDAVKMKYFRSLGMPPAENSSSQPMPIRGRSRTANDTQISPKQFQYPIYASSVPESRQTRSVSTPIPISSEDARSPPSRPFLLDEDDEGGSDGNDGEIDFYAKMQRLHKKGGVIASHEVKEENMSFNVGTARSVAVWEQQRRKNMMNV